MESPTKYWEGLNKFCSPERQLLPPVRYPFRGIQEGGAYGSKEKSQEEKEKVNYFGSLVS
jgi:hypothetical protein